MLKRWILYLATVSGCIVFYLAHRQWFAWFALICVLCLPIVALLTSLPAMIKLKFTSGYPVSVPVGTEQSVHPPWETDAGAAFVAAPSPVARSSMIPS